MPKSIIIPEDLQGVTRFNVQITEIEEINDLFSKCSVKILYPGLNRNNVFIEKDVANEMAKTLYNIPIVGEFVETVEDFKDHGGKIEITTDDIQYVHTTKPYGFVPEGAPISWELVSEDDGTQREYLTCVGYLWTGRYPEAKTVINESRPQSMELDEDSLEGYWKQEQGNTIFHITKAKFSALCILGNDVPPAFESAQIGNYMVSNPIAFSKQLGKLIRSLEESLAEDTKKVVNFSIEKDNNEGGLTMEKTQFIFELDHDSIKAQIYNKINPLKEDGSRDWNYYVSKIYDDRVAIIDESTETPYRQSYKIENDIVEFVGDKIQVEIKDLTPQEVAAIDQVSTSYEALQKEFSEFKEQNTTDESEELQQLKEENTSLKEFKQEVETKDKEQVISSFSQILTEEQVSPFKEKLGEFTKEQLKEKLAVIAFETVDFSANRTNEDLIPDNTTNNSEAGWEKIVQKHNTES